MAFSINKVILVGNVGKDPDIRSTQDGLKIASFSLATTESWKDKMTGDRKEHTEWHRIVVFNSALSEICEKYLHKGSKVYIEGQLQTRKWADSSNVDKFITEVIVPRFRGELIIMSGDKVDSAISFDNISMENDPEFNDDIPF